jgi:signal transduction histidine kinase
VGLALGTEEVKPSIRVQRTMPPDGDVLVDAAQVETAIANLVRNAVEAMPGGGELTIEAYREGRTMHLLIRDTGSGIPEEVRSRIFEPLVTTKSLGLGLGLVTAQTLIEGQNGRIVLRSTSPQGTTFEITLPVP